MYNPLSIYILWHYKNIQGHKYAKNIFSTYTRDVNKPTERGIGIPTYFLSNPKNLVQKIDWKNSHQVVVLFFIDQHMIIEEGMYKWGSEILDVYDHCDRKNALFYPIAMDRNASNFCFKLNTSNRLNL